MHRQRSLRGRQVLRAERLKVRWQDVLLEFLSGMRRSALSLLPERERDRGIAPVEHCRADHRELRLTADGRGCGRDVYIMPYHAGRHRVLPRTVLARIERVAQSHHPLHQSHRLSPCSTLPVPALRAARLRLGLHTGPRERVMDRHLDHFALYERGHHDMVRVAPNVDPVSEPLAPNQFSLASAAARPTSRVS